MVNNCVSSCAPSIAMSHTSLKSPEFCPEPHLSLRNKIYYCRMMKDFEQACQDKNIKLFVLPPRSPKLNGGVERINQTWRTLVYNFRDDLPENILQLSDFVKHYQHFYNFDRPHKALDFLSPFDYFLNISSSHIESHML